MRLVGENVKRLRTRRGLNQAELSMLSGLSRFTISKIEARDIEAHSSTLRKLASGLGVSVEDLFDETAVTVTTRGDGHPSEAGAPAARQDVEESLTA